MSSKLRTTLVLPVAAALAAFIAAPASATLIGGADTIDPVTVHNGTIVNTITTLSYVSGGDGLQGTADGTTWSATGDTQATALANADHLWAQFDPAILFHSLTATSSLLAIPAIDHGWTSGNTGEFFEPFEFQIFACTTSNVSSCTIAGVITDVYTRGVDDIGSSKNADDWSSVWAFNGSYNYFLLTSGDRLVNGPYSPGEGEIDALAVLVPEPSTLAIIGLALLSLLGLGVMRRRADA
jgi:PEP-CTERM motif